MKDYAKQEWLKGKRDFKQEADRALQYVVCVVIVFTLAYSFLHVLSNNVGNV